MSNLKDSIENLKKITSEEETEISENAEESHSVNVEALHSQKPTFYEEYEEYADECLNEKNIICEN